MGDLRPRLAPGAYLVGAAPSAASVPYETLKTIMSEAMDELTAGTHP